MSASTPLKNISPIDGRYSDKTQELSQFFSEEALIRYRVFVEIKYLLALAKMPIPRLSDITEDQCKQIQQIFDQFDGAAAEKIKEIEKTTNHDVKAVEYYIKEQLAEFGLDEVIEYVHFGLTSQDINNTAVPLSLKDGINDHFIPELQHIIDQLRSMGNHWSEVSMLARTHGQPASPTKMGKEINVFSERLEVQLDMLKSIPYSAKFGGATGNLNAHLVTFPDTDWLKFANDFVNNDLGLSRSQTTTQIEHYDNLAAIFDSLKRINTILIDLCRDIWTYISINYFTQKTKKGEIGSSAMPHKVNPIDFENAEGNLGIANAMYEFFASKLPISRMQRDLTDSTVLRNIGVPLAHTFVGLKSIMKGLHKIDLNESALRADLENNWAVVSEAIQTILRREGIENPYEVLLNLTRGNQHINEESIKVFIASLNVSEEVKKELLLISPHNYTGIA